jgi:hypothetical protein
MVSREITHQNIFRVLIAGFSLVILLLLAGVLIIGAVDQGFPAMFGDAAEDALVVIFIVYVVVCEIGRRITRKP